MTKITARRLIFRFCITLLTFLLGLGVYLGWENVKGVPYSDQLDLTVVSKTPVVKAGEHPIVTIYITNHGNDTVTLVQPGDASDFGWRTPIVWWSIREIGDFRPHATSPDFTRGTRCGNIQPLARNEVFTLAPGETKVIDSSLILPRFKKPGSYTVKFFYSNHPFLEWRGHAMGSHDRIAMWRVKNSTETNLSSNELLFTVTE